MTTMHPDEKVGITRIILRQPRRGTQAVLTSFWQANRTLAAWLTEEAREACNYDFEIRYEDGVRLAGAYNQRLRERGIPSLSRYIMRNKLVNAAFLQRY